MWAAIGMTFGADDRHTSGMEPPNCPNHAPMLAIVLVLLLRFDHHLLSRGLIVAVDPVARLAVDTGGGSVVDQEALGAAVRRRYGYSRRIPRSAAYVDRYYHGLMVRGALGVDWIKRRPLQIDFSAKGPGLTAPGRIPLHIVDHGLTDAYVSCVIGGEALTMLFDSGAIAWRATPRDVRGQAQGVSFLSHSVFERWRRQHPSWPIRRRALEVVREDGRVEPADAIQVPAVASGSAAFGPQWFVERNDGTTYAALKKLDGVTASGDLGTVTFLGTSLTIDYGRSELRVRPVQ